MRAIFHKEFNYTSRRVNAGWTIKPSKKIQNFPREVVEAAIKAGHATEAAPAKPAKE